MKRDKLTVQAIQSMFNLYDHQRVEGVFITNDMNQLRKHFSGNQHLFDGLMIGMCFDGSNRIKVNHSEYFGEKGDLMILLPHTLIESELISPDFRTITIVISLDFIVSYPILRDFISNEFVRNNPIVKLSDLQYSLMMDYMSFLQRYYYEALITDKEEVLRHLIFALISSISKVYRTLPESSRKFKDRKDKIVDDFYVLLSQNYKKERAVSFYADKLYLTPKYLTTVIRERTGKSILAWINEAVIIYAKFLLKSTTMTINEISQELQFSDASVFCRFFKRYAQKTPNEYRLSS
ncbi:MULTISPECIES: helix-turn-helix domain-containing protein [Myroides]|uniref:Helix-turn-helix domain-containing protein n=1 Tax=Myroides albus TaxID=2562892 RepID=A0A6I3LH62_9FLAO|nr:MULTISPECIES: helix-turn-helix transcriptional regulator [Myroides]MTG97838.1 helix-turn-helix domain-containing protein [Myroides albus]MVX35960.1 helix-turn-helix domain-containing protein [Myroides sp. LoEW2-1]UVD79795.1 helix-turn-helix transcriptional regulator [Myroides albus]